MRNILLGLCPILAVAFGGLLLMLAEAFGKPAQVEGTEGGEVVDAGSGRGAELALGAAVVLFLPDAVRDLLPAAAHLHADHLAENERRDLGGDEPVGVGRPEGVGVVEARVPALVGGPVDQQVELVALHRSNPHRCQSQFQSPSRALNLSPFQAIRPCV